MFLGKYKFFPSWISEVFFNDSQDFAWFEMHVGKFHHEEYWEVKGYDTDSYIGTSEQMLIGDVEVATNLNQIDTINNTCWS